MQLQSSVRLSNQVAPLVIGSPLQSSGRSPSHRSPSVSSACGLQVRPFATVVVVVVVVVIVVVVVVVVVVADVVAVAAVAAAVGDGAA